MPQRKGFPQAQLDTNFAADPKHRRLAKRLGMIGHDDENEALVDLYQLSGIGLWALCVAYAWSNDETNVNEVVDDQPKVIVQALVDCHLLEQHPDGVHVPTGSFEKWTERARMQRASARDRMARLRGSSPNTTELRESSESSYREVEVDVEDGYTRPSISPPGAGDPSARNGKGKAAHGLVDPGKKTT